jgi:hypothetical protein
MLSVTSNVNTSLRAQATETASAGGAAAGFVLGAVVGGYAGVGIAMAAGAALNDPTIAIALGAVGGAAVGTLWGSSL